MVAPTPSTGLGTGRDGITNIALFPVEQDGLGEVGSILQLVQYLDAQFSSEWPGQLGVTGALNKPHIHRDMAPLALAISISIDAETHSVPSSMREEFWAGPSFVLCLFHTKFPQFERDGRHH